MFPSGETSQSDAGDGEERDELAGEDHGPGSPGVVRQQDQHAGRQVEIANHSLAILNKRKDLFYYFRSLYTKKKHCH